MTRPLDLRGCLGHVGFRLAAGLVMDSRAPGCVQVSLVAPLNLGRGFMLCRWLRGPWSALRFALGFEGPAVALETVIEVQARLDAVEGRLEALEQRVGTGPHTIDLDEQIGRVRGERLDAADVQK